MEIVFSGYKKYIVFLCSAKLRFVSYSLFIIEKSIPFEKIIVTFVEI
jgi:hypothetical protein